MERRGIHSGDLCEDEDEDDVERRGDHCDDANAKGHVWHLLRPTYTNSNRLRGYRGGVNGISGWHSHIKHGTIIDVT